MYVDFLLVVGGMHSMIATVHNIYGFIFECAEIHNYLFCSPMPFILRNKNLGYYNFFISTLIYIHNITQTE